MKGNAITGNQDGSVKNAVFDTVTLSRKGERMMTREEKEQRSKDREEFLTKISYHAVQRFRERVCGLEVKEAKKLLKKQFLRSVEMVPGKKLAVRWLLSHNCELARYFRLPSGAIAVLSEEGVMMTVRPKTGGYREKRNDEC